MTIIAQITVYRDNEPVIVTLQGWLEKFGTANPYERGMNIGDWEVVEPQHIELTNDECDDAIEALERAI